MKVFKTKLFDHWAKDVGLCYDALYKAIIEIQQGLCDTNLGGYLYKKRIAYKNQGKSSSTRTIIAYKTNDKAFFLYGFEKNEKSNISDVEKKALKKLAKIFMALTLKDLQLAKSRGELKEVQNEGQ